MRRNDPKTIFLRWLNAALQDERWRAFISDRLRDSELPVIDLENDDRGMPGES